MSVIAQRRAILALGAALVVSALVLLDLASGVGYPLMVTALAAVGIAISAAIGSTTAARPPWLRLRVDRLDLVFILVLYALVVVGFRLAFTVFTQANVLGLFLSFGAALLLGVAGPVAYGIWRKRSVAALGLRVGDWRVTAGLAVLFAGAQYALTLGRFEYPATDAWLPLLAMSLVVGFFEAVFFRGFMQNRLEASFGLAPAVTIAAAMYGAYHIGYGMGLAEMAFLFGLGLVYGVAFRLVRSVFVLWPLLTPLGSLFNQLQSGEVTMPMIAIFGFVDVFGLMLAAIWYAWKRERGLRDRSGGAQRPSLVGDGKRPRSDPRQPSDVVAYRGSN
jgi:membrane protease YdiL (CAAX protease family)